LASTLVSLSKALNGIASTFEWLEASSNNRCQLDSKTKTVPLLVVAPGQCTSVMNTWTKYCTIKIL